MTNPSRHWDPSLKKILQRSVRETANFSVVTRTRISRGRLQTRKSCGSENSFRWGINQLEESISFRISRHLQNRTNLTFSYSVGRHV